MAVAALTAAPALASAAQAGADGAGVLRAPEAGQLPARLDQTVAATDGRDGFDRMGPMDGGAWDGPHHDDDHSDGPSAAAMVGVMAVLIAAVAVAVLWLGRRRRASGPLDTLERRFAAGEISAEEFRESKRLLEGS